MHTYIYIHENILRERERERERTSDRAIERFTFTYVWGRLLLVVFLCEDGREMVEGETYNTLLLWTFGPLWAEPLWAAPLWESPVWPPGPCGPGPHGLGPYWPGPYGPGSYRPPPWALVGRALMCRARMGLPGLLWAGPSLGLPVSYGPGLVGPGPHGPPWAKFSFSSGPP